MSPEPKIPPSVQVDDDLHLDIVKSDEEPQQESEFSSPWTAWFQETNTAEIPYEVYYFPSDFLSLFLINLQIH